MEYTFTLPEEKQVVASLSKRAVIDREGFRIHTSRAYETLSKTDRSTLHTLEAEGVAAHRVLNKWKHDVQPLLQELESHQTKAVFRSTLAKHLLLEDDKARSKVERLVHERRKEVLEQCVSELYPEPCTKNKHKDTFAKQRLHAKQLLSKSHQELEDLRQRYVSYLLHKEIAAKYNIAAVDPHTPWPRRVKTTRQIRADLKKTIRAENERLASIEQRLAIIHAMHGGLMGEINNRQWDIVTIFTLRAQYEKQLAKLPSNDAKSPLKRLALFEKATKDFRSKQVEQLASNSANNSLASARAATEAIDTLLLRIFDLTNTEKNQLLVLAGEIRELAKEKAAIAHTRKLREQAHQKVQ